MIIPERITKRVKDKCHWEKDCLVSDYSISTHGYTQIGWQENKVRSHQLCHRVIWIFYFGPIPHGKTIDHKCKNKKCININHLRLLDNFENARRTYGRDWQIGTCVRGHSNDHLITAPNGRTRCRICKREDKENWRDRQRAKGLTPP